MAILHPNRHEFLEAYFAAAQIGAVLNPLNFRLSPRELAFILNDSGAGILIAAARFRDSVKALEEVDTPVRRVIWTGPGERSAAFEAMEYEEIVRTHATTVPPPPSPHGR